MVVTWKIYYYTQVRLTWDETDPKRMQATMRKFDKDEIDKMNFNDYIASASSDEGEDEDEEGGI